MTREWTAASGRDPLATPLDEAGATAFLAVGRGDDPTTRYLLGLDSPADADLGFLYVGGDVAASVPATREAAPSLPPAVEAVPRPETRPVGRHVASLLAARAESGTVLAPASLPHDAALYVENAGFDLASTPAVGAARAVKSARELDRLRAAQGMADAGVDRAAAVLREATVESRDGDDAFVVDGSALTPARLRAGVAAAVAREGAVGVDVRVRARGETLSPRDPVVVAVRPRGPRGYHGRAVRTFAPGSDGGWDRRAHVAVESALRVASAELRPGGDASFVREEVLAELSSFGFGPADAVDDVGGGIGLAAREAPLLTGEATLEAGHVVAVAPGVTGTGGTIRLGGVFVVTDEGSDRLGDGAQSLVP